jgi:hypothetical protein
LEAPPGFEQGWRFCGAIPGRFGRFSEHRDSDFSSDSRQGFENGDVAMLAALIRLTRTVSQLLQQLLELAATRQALRVDDLQTWQDQPNLRFHGFDDTRRVRKERGLKSGHDLGTTPPTNPVGTQQMIDPGPRETALRRRRRRELQQRPEPPFIRPWAQREHLGYEPMHLTPQLVGQAAKVRVQIFLGPREFPELHHDGVLSVHLLKCGQVGPQRIRQDPRIPTIVLGAGNRVAIAKPIELLRIYRKHQAPTRETRIHHEAFRWRPQSAPAWLQ